MASSLFSTTADALTKPGILGLALGFAVLILVRRFLSASASSDIPVRGHFARDDLREVIRNEYLNRPDRAYALQLAGRRTIVVPFSLKHEYGWLADDRASPSEDLYDRSLGWYTGFGSYNPHEQGDSYLIDTTYAKVPLTRNISATLPRLYEELDYALSKEVGDASEPKPFGALILGSSIAARVFQRIYVGPELSRNESWLKACSTIGLTIGKTAAALSRYPEPLRRLAAPFIGQVRDFHRSQAELEAFIKPLQEQCVDGEGPESLAEPANFISFYVNNAGPDRKRDAHNLGICFVGLNFAGITSIGFVLHELLLEVAAHPHVAEELRAEILAVKEKTNTAKLSQDGLDMLVKMDSFIKECLRVHTASVFSMTRKIKKDLRLSNGQVIPGGSYVVTAGSLNDRIGLVKDVDGEFDAFRWYRMRKGLAEDSKYGWVTAGNNTMGFGYGVHACPGRFFATNAVKAMISEIILRYNITMPDGQSRLDPVISKQAERQFDFVSRVMLQTKRE